MRMPCLLRMRHLLSRCEYMFITRSRLNTRAYIREGAEELSISLNLRESTVIFAPSQGLGTDWRDPRFDSVNEQGSGEVYRSTVSTTFGLIAYQVLPFAQKSAGNELRLERLYPYPKRSFQNLL